MKGQVMGHWGVRSYENDEADFAIDAGFDRVHGEAYEDLMDDRNPMTVDQIHKKLAEPRTLVEAIKALEEDAEGDWDDWDEVDRLGYAGVVVRHAELGVPIPVEVRDRALDALRGETIEWDEATARMLRRHKEIDLLSGNCPA